jgi:threonine aldolase
VLKLNKLSSSIKGLLIFKGIDLSSDTATKPTSTMKKAMLKAELGDEQKNEDPTTIQLEDLITEITGFSDAVFLPSATMANQIAISTLSTPGSELICSKNSHVYCSEYGGPSIHANVMCNPIPSDTGIFSAEEIIKSLDYTQNKKQAPFSSSLISIENTTNLGGGIAWSEHKLNEIVTCANKLSLKKHMDGARIFNAHIKTGLAVSKICNDFDMVTICLSKGLGCPGGSLLAFGKKYATEVRYRKHLMGGFMRQSGMLAAAGLFALQNNIKRLEVDHENAKLLANKLSTIKNICVLNNPPETNIVFFELESKKISPDEFLKGCIQKGVRFSWLGFNKFKAVTHLDVSHRDVQLGYRIVKQLIS